MENLPSYKNLANFSYEIVTGMQYLATNQVNSKVTAIFYTGFI